MKDTVRCSYCKNKMEYGESNTTYIAAHFSVDKNLNLPKEIQGERFICWPCQWRMMDWLAEASGCVHGEAGIFNEFERIKK